MNIPDELQSVIELQMRNLHYARQAETEAKAALEKHDAEDPEISRLQKELADAQKKLDEKLAADETRKALQTTVTVASEHATQLYESFRDSAGRAKMDNPDLEAKQLPGVASFKLVEEAVIVDDEKALQTAFELLRGVPGLLKIDTTVLLKMHQNGLLREEWQRKSRAVALAEAQSAALNYAFGMVPVQPRETEPEKTPDTGWYEVNRSVKAGVDSDLSKAIKKLEKQEVNPALLIEVKLDKSA